LELIETASLVQLSRPDELGFIEFLDCPSIKAKHPRAIAWRIDGDSMSPRYEDDDFVIVSPDEPAAEGYPCVAHQTGQIGVNCKIYSRAGDDVILIPINESAPPHRVKAGEIAWAHRVLYSVRLGP
jgi:phage repressor protein C with HTH and peptisase S24 domain